MSKGVIMREKIKSFNKNISEDRRSMLLLPSLFVVLMAALVVTSMISIRQQDMALTS